MIREWIDKVILSSLNRNAEKLSSVFELKQQDDVSIAKQSLERTFQKDLLVNDFQQCMYMLRHYDSVNWDLTKFSFGQILVVIGACWTILNHEREVGKTLLDVYKDGISNYIVGGILVLSTCFVFLTLTAIMRNRTYFVLMGRYLNEHRRNVFKDKPFGFENESKMWNNPAYPTTIDWKSTQMICVILFFICYILLSFMALYSLLFCCKNTLCVSLICTLIIGFVGYCILKKMSK